MAGSIFHLRVFVLAAYVFAAVLPVLTFTGNLQPPRVEHEQMMAMAGHLGHMPTSNASLADTQLLLCQQHCLFGAALFPEPGRTEMSVERSIEIDLTEGLPVASLATPPPGPPPKLVRV